MSSAPVRQEEMGFNWSTKEFFLNQIFKNTSNDDIFSHMVQKGFAGQRLKMTEKISGELFKYLA